MEVVQAEREIVRLQYLWRIWDAGNLLDGALGHFLRSM